MSVSQVFPRALAASFALCLLTLTAAAQTDFARPRQVVEAKEADGTSRLVNDPFVVSLAEPEKGDLTKRPFFTPPALRLSRMMLQAIEQRLGSPYVFGSSGPNVFDCSGFVWSVFREAGISFERTNARTFWAEFLPAREDEKFKFGTLVFFNNLKHVGIVADADGFYHASTTKGVTYSPFNDYWASRVVGFRRVPLPAETPAE